ncbi:hypothetical protein MLD38_012840 [Melastoma candidum]|uniref:Uncharacterized protein n=1 Tax=Melastoma candidum TaxID=119954 RepID=A0ACB9RG25_9MYRT|nr:hypothetical protein MLD38_012840 [Melastoma candidum]
MGDAHAIPPRRGSFGPRDGNPQHNNYRNRRDQGRRNPPDRRDGRLQQQQRGVARGYRGPPPPTLNAPVYMAPQSVRPTFGPSIGFSDVSSPCFFPAFPMDMYRSPTYMPPPPPQTGIMMPMPTIPLPALLVKQIDYYFSDDNLVKDDYLKSNMDNQGWVPISLIAGFPRVRTLTDNVEVILESLGDSSIVEVKEDKIRRRGEWMKWVRFPAHGWLDLGSPSSVVTNGNDGSLASSLQNIALEGKSSVDSAAEKNSQMEDSDPHGNSSERMASF